MFKVLFICHGNICRSPMAEAIFKDKVKKLQLEKLFIVNSAAVSIEEIGNPVYYKTIETLKKHNIVNFSHSARRVTIDDYHFYDCLFVMDQSNYRSLMNIIGDDPVNKVKMLGNYLDKKHDIEDPWYTRNFELVFKELSEAIENYLKEILNELPK